ncbi:short-chain dehydrogenase [Actinomycetota bacterium]|nr:short-chain dehydrogenase [Actinomycetota bacterium]
MTPRTVVLTGASDGIGAAAARALVTAGHQVVLVGRSPVKTAAVAAELGADHLLADYTRLDEVQALAATLRERYPHIDVLANNAGGIMGARETTVDGFEATLQVNHLAPFLLTHLLLDTLVASRATVIATSSAGARLFGQIDLADLQLERGWSSNHAYGNGKLANILFTRELHRRFGGQGVAAVAFHPGVVATNFAAETGGVMRAMYHTPLRRLLTTPAAGASTLEWLVEGRPGTDWQPGQFYTKRAVARTHAQADDPELARELWDRSEQLVGVSRRP